MDDTGAPTAAAATWSGDGGYKLWGNQTGIADGKLMEGFLYAWNTAAVSVASLPGDFGRYQVLVYSDGENAAQGSNHVQRFVLTAGTDTETVYLNDKAKDYTNSNYWYPGYRLVPESSKTAGYTALGVSDVPDGNCILFTNGGTGFTGDFSLTATAMNDAPGTQWAQTNINAIQVIKAGQSSTPFASWAKSKGLGGSPGKKNGVADDPDKDARTNLQEFAFNGDPLSATSTGQSHVLTADSSAYPDAAKELVLTLALRKGTVFTAGIPATSAPVDGITYAIEGGTNLAGFGTKVWPVTTINPGVALTDNVNYEYRSFALDGSNSLPGKGFLRAKVTTSP